MKLTTISLLVFALQISAKGLAQEKISLSFDKAPLEKVFNSIMSQTKYSIICRNEYVKDIKVSVQAKDLSIEQALDLCLKNLDLTYEIVGSNIAIRPKKKDADTSISTESATATFLDITGRVTTTQGEPLQGANVTIKRTGTGTITNANGQFQLKNVNSDDIIIISYVGYAPLTVKVGTATILNLTMNIASNKLDVAVVQAYGNTTERLNTGNITTVTSQEIERQPVMNPLQALQGKVAGLEITQANGYSSAPVKVELRGRKLLNNLMAPDPLYIVDGVPLTVLDLTGASPEGSKGFIQNGGGILGPAGGQSPLFSLNPNDIESITVLKDADATAIYGSRGGNGVIIITTKKGKAGRTKLDINVYKGISEVPNNYDMLTTSEYVMMRTEALKNNNRTPTVAIAPDLLLWDTTSAYTNWQNFLWGKSGTSLDAEMALSGGKEATSFRFGAGYHRETSVTNVSGSNQRASLQFNATHRNLNQRLVIDFTGFYSFTTINEIGFSTSMSLLPPNAPEVFDSLGNLNFEGWRPTTLFGFNSLLKPYTSKTGFLNSQMSLKYEILRGLNISTSLGYSSHSLYQKYLSPIKSEDPRRNPTGSAVFGNDNGIRWIIEPKLEYKIIVGKGDLNVLVGGTLQKVNQYGNSINGSGYVDDNLLHSIANAPVKDATDVQGQYKYAAAFGRVNYNFKNRYIANFSARRDGSSRFGPGKQYGNFGAIGLAWIFSETKLLKKIPWISYAKLRGSYGITGSDFIGDYNYLTRWAASSNYVLPYQATSYVPIQHANPDLQWQENKKLELGLNTTFLNGKLSVDLALYRDRCGNQLVNMPIPVLTGFPQVLVNRTARVQNSGIESSFRAQIIDLKEVNWNFYFNIGINRNKLLSFPDIEMSPYYGTFFVGQPLNLSKVYHYFGIDPQTGLYIVEDKNKDGKITANAITGDFYTRDNNIRYQGGFGTDVTFKGLQLSLFFSYRHRPFVRSAIYNSTFYPGMFGFGNQSKQVLDRWQKPGDEAKFARFTTQPAASDLYFTQSDGVYSDGSFIRLRNVSISYELPISLVQTINFKTCKFFIKGENLLLISNYNGVDPETPNFGQLPLQRVVVGGINIGL